MFTSPVLMSVQGSVDTQSLPHWSGTYYPMVSGVTTTTASFTGSKGHTYALYSQATDNVGNVEDAHSSPDVTITIPDQTSPVLNRISPSTAPIGTLPVPFTASGSGYTNNSVIRADGSSLATHYVSAAELQSEIPASYLTSARSISIEVQNSDSGLISNSLPFTATSNSTWIINATSSPNGTITPSGQVSVVDRADQIFTMTPNTGYTIADVVVDGGSVGPKSSYTFQNVTANHTISAQFTISTGQHTINATADDWTVNYPSGKTIYPEGSNQTQIIQPKPGADLVNVTVDNATQGAVPSWTFTNITSDHDITTKGTPTPGQVHVFFNASTWCGQMPLTVNFTDVSLGSPTSWYWQFGDGTNSTVQNASHVYTTPGVYTVTLRCTNNQTGGYGIWNNGITVTTGQIPEPTPTPVPDKIIPSFSVTPVNGTSPLTVQCCDASSGNPASWLWSFGDGTTSTVQNPNHQYTRTGTFSITLLTQNNWYSGSLTKTDAVVVQ